MAILSLRTFRFRNLTDAEIDTNARDIFLIGENGQGKTNFLEALYFCAYAASFKGVKDGEMARNGEQAFSASASLGFLRNSFWENGFFLSSRITVKVDKSRKYINLDEKKVEDRKDLLEAVPCVVFCHEDMDFVSGSQERRRWFFDQTQSLYDSVYLDDLRRYRRVLRNRNAAIRESKTSGNNHLGELLDAMDPQLAGYGVRLMEKRLTAAEKFSTLFRPLYREVSGIDGVGITYVPSWKSTAEAMRFLKEKRPADLAQGHTVSGPHRDRYLFIQDASSGNCDGRTLHSSSAGRGEFSAAASTGQRRLLALLLRAAQARCFSDASGKTPVLLLDDVLLELDGEKRRRFFSVMPDYEQAFFTFLPEEPYEKYRKSGTLVYHVSGGVVSKTPDTKWSVT